MAIDALQHNNFVMFFTSSIFSKTGSQSNNACLYKQIQGQNVEEWQEKLPAGPILHDFRRTAVRKRQAEYLSSRTVTIVDFPKNKESATNG